MKRDEPAIPVGKINETKRIATDIDTSIYDFLKRQKGDQPKPETEEIRNDMARRLSAQPNVVEPRTSPGTPGVSTSAPASSARESSIDRPA